MDSFLTSLTLALNLGPGALPAGCRPYPGDHGVPGELVLASIFFIMTMFFGLLMLPAVIGLLRWVVDALSSR